MSVEAALAALRGGRPVLVVDDAGEADVVLAAHGVTVEWVAWTVRHTSGFLFAPMPAARADELHLPPMVPRNQDPHGSTHTVSVDARNGVTTGISAADRARTLRTLSAPGTTPDDLIRPGHVVPLCTRPGGVLERPRHAEAAVDLCTLADLPPVGVIATLVADEGSTLRLPGVEHLASRYALPVLTVAELVYHRLRQDGVINPVLCNAPKGMPVVGH